MASTGSLRPMEKPSQDHQNHHQQQQNNHQPLKCPRCDSSNTKFCYYNNYSLSQPRHFCKACKRYWTRGGTLRNVPVGGGCRKNKRVKRPNTSSSSTEASSLSSANPSATSNTNPSMQPHLDLSPNSAHLNPMFYGVPTNPSELNLPYPRLSSGFDLQPQINLLGLGFSSRALLGGGNNESYRNGFNSSKQIHDGNVITTSNTPVFSSYPIHGSSTSSNSTASTLASLIASSLQQQQQKLVSSANNFQGLLPLENLNMASGNNNLEGGMMMMMKEMKMEGGGQSRLDNWNINNHNSPHNHHHHHQIEQINSSSDPASLWNITGGGGGGGGVGAWLHDPSVPSLI